jgi:RND family efflux transporter MFP subunit
MVTHVRIKTLLGLVFCAVLLLSCGKKEEPKEIIRPVRYKQVFLRGGIRTRSFNGVAQAGMESKLSFKVPGTVNQVAVSVGDQVKTGQLLVKLDPIGFQLNVQKAEAALSDTRAQFRNAQSNYERVRALYENGSVSLSELDASRAASESAGASVQTAEKQLELARLQLSYARLSAPVNGAIAQVNVEVNENVRVGQPIIFLTSGSQIEVEISVPENLISMIEEGDSVAVKFDAVPGKEYPGTIIEVGVASTGMGTTYPVKVQLIQSNIDIRSGMAAVVLCQLESKDKRELILVPPVAVTEDREGRFVYVVIPIAEEEGFAIVHRMPVKVGEFTEDGIEILDGIADGDLIVIAGVSQITDGLKVKI